MPTVAASSPLARALLPARRCLVPRPSLASPPPSLPSIGVASSKPRALVVVASSAASFDELDAKGRSRPASPKKSVLSNLIQEIEPLDVSLIQKDVPADTVDAMKRTISGMLGLLPSDHFHVMVEAFWDSLFKLLVSSMMTGYTLRNAEYRLCLEKTLDVNEEHFEKKKQENVDGDSHEIVIESASTMFKNAEKTESLANSETSEEIPACENIGIGDLGEISTEAQEYILLLQSRLSSVKKELHDIKRKNYARQMQQFVGEEKNDLLDYLRSLQPEKVAELSEPTCPSVQETIHSVAHGLLATLSPKLHAMATPQSENEDDLVFQPLISVSRDYLARLLFWCMLLGHYIRGLEYRLELMQLFTISGVVGYMPEEGDDTA